MRPQSNRLMQIWKHKEKLLEHTRPNLFMEMPSIEKRHSIWIHIPIHTLCGESLVHLEPAPGAKWFLTVIIKTDSGTETSLCSRPAVGDGEGCLLQLHSITPAMQTAISGG